ncbi:MAG TPA: RNA pseudouridine synthase, partial [Phycisphaerales bacterium]|nr:RNA pseudouridine synthase [Phycisphaerales bacterium]
MIDLPIGIHPTIRKRYAVRHDSTGKASVTLYRVREVYEDYTLVELELRTGRT